MRIIFDPHAIAHVPVQPRPTVPVRMDQLPASRRPDPLPRDLHRTALWLPRLARRLGHALHRRHLAPQTLDHLLQADRAGQRARRAPGPRAVSPGAGGAALRCADPGPRRHAGAAFLGVGARLRVSPRPQSQDQPATVPARAVLGHRRGERARPWRGQPGAADSLPPGAGDRQPQQARDCTGAAARTGGGGRQAGAGAVRFLVYARPSGVAFAAPTDAGDRSGAHRHGTVSAAGGTDDLPGAGASASMASG